MYKIFVFLFFLQMTVAKPQGGVNIPPETTAAESTTKNDVELFSDGTTKSENISSETTDISSDPDTTTDSAATSASVNDVNSTTTTQESSSSEGSASEDTSESNENCDKDNEVIEIIFIDPELPPMLPPVFPPFFKK